MAQVQDLEERVRTVCGHLNAAHAQLVDLTVEAIESGAWAGVGVRSVQHWLTWQCGISAATAGQILRLAEAKATHPVTSAVFAEGRLSLDQAAIAVTAPAHCDEAMADLAPLSTVSQLRIEVRVATPPATPDPADRSGESVASWFDSTGRWHLKGQLDGDRGRIVDAALREARDRLFHDGQADVSNADALVDVAERSLDRAPVERRQRYRVNLFIDPTANVPATWGDGFNVTEAIREYLTCDGTITPTFTQRGRPVSVGPTIKGIHDRIRRLVLARDKQCRVPWCSSSSHLDVHHIVHRADGGPTATWNLMGCCRRCHRHHHLGGFDITGTADDPDGLTFTDPHGRVIDPAARPRPPTGPPPEPAQPYQHPLGERLDTRWLSFPEPTAAA